MRNQTYNQQGQLVADLELYRDAQGNAKVKDWLAGTEWAANTQQEANLKEEERTTKRGQARERAIAAIKANKGQSPWGQALYDLAITLGLIEPE